MARLSKNDLSFSKGSPPILSDFGRATKSTKSSKLYDTKEVLYSLDDWLLSASMVFLVRPLLRATFAKTNLTRKIYRLVG